MKNVKNLASFVILSTGSLLITGCGFFGSNAVRVINLSKLDVPDSNLAIIDSRQKQRLTDDFKTDISDTLTLYPEEATSSGNHLYKLTPGKHSLKISWVKSIITTETVYMNAGEVDKKGVPTAATIPMDLPNYTPVANHTYSFSTMLLPGHIYSIETPLEDENDSNPNGSPKRVCIETSPQNKDEKLLKWTRVGCTSG